jgi:hypothetical protein
MATKPAEELPGTMGGHEESNDERHDKETDVERG